MPQAARQDQLQRQLAACNGYLRRIGDPIVTAAVVAELSDVLELPLKRVACFAKYGRLSGFEMPRTRTFSAAIPTSGVSFFTNTPA